MERSDHHIVGLDIGSSKTCALVCGRNASGKLEVAGFGLAESRGCRRGAIVNLDLAAAAVKKSVEAAETAAGVSVEAAYVGVGGGQISGVNSRGAVAVDTSAAGREVTREDVLKAVEAAQAISLPPDCTLLHVMRQEFLLDSQNGIRDPVGMVARRLEADVHLIMASATNAQNVVTAVNRAGIVVQDTVCECVASAEACLTADERELGVALVDIGGGSTELIVYRQGMVRQTASIPVGGEHFTNDIAVGLRTPIPEAEKMKQAWGERDPEKPYETMLEVAGVGERPSRVVSYSMLREIIEPRTIELLELLQAELARSGFDTQLGAGVVFVGGGAKLGELMPMAEQMLEVPVRVARATGLGKMGEVLADPAFATVVGLVTYGSRLALARDSQDRSLTGRLWRFLRGEKGN